MLAFTLDNCKIYKIALFGKVSSLFGKFGPF